jgi:hypothetical protein
MQISVTEARRIAQKVAEPALRPFMPEGGQDLLREEYAEAENCWFFFRNPEIFVPPEKSMKGDWAYAVSKRGTARQIADFFDDKEGLRAYLQTMSDYFGSRGL